MSEMGLGRVKTRQKALGMGFPVLYARNFPAPILLRIASAMMERAELPVQRKRT
jgi:hypothetical protein